jgi:hypothetical protein
MGSNIGVGRSRECVFAAQVDEEGVGWGVAGFGGAAFRVHATAHSIYGDGGSHLQALFYVRELLIELL